MISAPVSRTVARPTLKSVAVPPPAVNWMIHPVAKMGKLQNGQPEQHA